MRLVRTLSAIALTASLVSIPAAVQARSTSGSTTNVTTIVYDTDSSAATTLLQSDNFNGSGFASYTTVNNVVSNIYNGVLFLDLYRTGVTRTLYITPNDPYSPAQNPPVPIPPPGYYQQYVELVVRCYDQSLNVVPLQNILSSSSSCGLNLDFGYAGVKYKLAMGPSLPATGPATGLVSVSCNSLNGSQCVNWTINPSPNGSLANVANLYYYAKGGKLTYVGGQYYNTFRITVTAP